MYGIEKEAAIFLCACLSGFVVVLSYQILIVIRKMIRHHAFAVNIEDFLYWIGVSVYLFYQMYCTTYGIIRWYFVLGVVVGFCVSKSVVFRGSKLLWKIQKKLEKSGKTK